MMETVVAFGNRVVLTVLPIWDPILQEVITDRYGQITTVMATLTCSIAKCQGANNDAAIDELHRNNGDGTFTNVAEELGFADYHQSWASAWADYDNDGNMDVLVGGHTSLNVGNIIVTSSSKLMKNNGYILGSRTFLSSIYILKDKLDHLKSDFIKTLEL